MHRLCLPCSFCNCSGRVILCYLVLGSPSAYSPLKPDHRGWPCPARHKLPEAHAHLSCPAWANTSWFISAFTLRQCFIEHLLCSRHHARDFHTANFMVTSFTTRETVLSSSLFGSEGSDLGCKAVQTGSEFASCFGTDLVGKMGGEGQMDDTCEDTQMGAHSGPVATTWSLRESGLEAAAGAPHPPLSSLTKLDPVSSTPTPHVELYFLFKFGRKGKPQGGKENVLFFPLT